MISTTIKSLTKKINIKDIFVCTDNIEVFNHLKNKIYNVPILIKRPCLNGTERCSLAFEKIKKKYNYATIISCDLPSINPRVIEFLEKKASNKKNNADGYTVHAEIFNKEILKDFSTAKIVVSKKNRILYISRAGIPYPKQFVKGKFFSHHGIVMLKAEVLKKYKYLKNTNLQLIEDNEWLKLIENEYIIKSYLSQHMQPEINTKKDLYNYLKLQKNKNLPKKP